LAQAISSSTQSNLESSQPNLSHFIGTRGNMQRIAYVLASSLLFLSEGIQQLPIAANASQNLTSATSTLNCGGFFQNPCFWLTNSYDNCPGVDVKAKLVPGPPMQIEAGGATVDVDLKGSTTEAIEAGSAVAFISGEVTKCPSIVSAFFGCKINIKPEIITDACDAKNITLTLGLLTTLSTITWPGLDCPIAPGPLKFKGPMQIYLNSISSLDQSVMQNSPVETKVSIKHKGAPNNAPDIMCIKSTNSLDKLDKP